MPNYFQIGPVVLQGDFYVYPIYTSEKLTSPLAATDQIHFSNLGRKSLQDHLCRIIFKFGSIVFDKKIFKVFFSFGCHGNHNSKWNGTILATFEGDYLGFIPVTMFIEIQPSGLGGDFV